ASMLGQAATLEAPPSDVPARVEAPLVGAPNDLPVQSTPAGSASTTSPLSRTSPSVSEASPQASPPRRGAFVLGALGLVGLLGVGLAVVLSKQGATPSAGAPASPEAVSTNEPMPSSPSAASPPVVDEPPLAASPAPSVAPASQVPAAS